jgi:hypothetical protein
MPVPIVNSTSSATGQTGSTFTVNAPSGINNGDLLVAIQSEVLNGGSSSGPPAGWSVANTYLFSALNAEVLIFYKTASSEPGSYTFNNSSGLGPTTNVLICDIQYPGGHPPIYNTNWFTGTSATGSSTAMTAPGLSSGVLPVLNIATFAWVSNTSITPPSGYTDLGTLSNLVISQESSTFNYGLVYPSTQNATLSAGINWIGFLMNFSLSNPIYNEGEDYYPAAPWSNPNQSIPWISSLPAIALGTILGLTAADEADAALFYTGYKDQEEGWILNKEGNNLLLEKIPWDNRTFLDDDLLEPISPVDFYRDQEEGYFPLVETVSWLAKIYNDDSLDDIPGQNIQFDQDDEQMTYLPNPSIQNSGYLPQAYFSGGPLLNPDFDEGISTSTLYWYEDEAGPPSKDSQETIPWLPRPFLDEGIDFTGNNWNDQEDSPQVEFSTERIPWFPITFLDEGIDRALFFFGELEELLNTKDRVESILWSPIQFLDEGIDSNLFSYGEDEFQSPFEFATQLVPTSRFTFLDEGIDDTSGLKFFILTEEDDLFNPPTQLIPWSLLNPGPPLVPLPGVDDELRPNYPTPFPWVEQEEPYVSSLETLPWFPLPFLDDEVGSRPWLSFLSDQDSNDLTRVISQESIPWSSFFFTDEEIESSLGQQYREQEEPSSIINSGENSIWSPCIFLDDEIGASLVNFYSTDTEEIVQSTRAVESITWVARPYLDDEANAKLLFLEQEEPWIAQTERIDWLPTPFSYDEIGSGLVNQFLDQEELYGSLVEYLPWSVYLLLDEQGYFAFTPIPNSPTNIIDIFASTITLTGKSGGG